MVLDEDCHFRHIMNHGVPEKLNSELLSRRLFKLKTFSKVKEGVQDAISKH
jgi:hypothetical protein